MEMIYGDEVCRALIHTCICFKSSDLNSTILDSTQTANFKERYVLGDQLGWGRFGIIRECSDKLTGEVLACKSISKERLVTEEDVRSVKREIEILTKLSGHENVVDLKAVYEDEDYVHLLMELCAGGELFHWIEKRGRLSEQEAHIIFKQLMEVIMYCHDKGIVHRDLKPENILLVSKASISPIKLADFGLATHVEPGQMLKGTVGSPFYIAPEVLAGNYDQAADVWSAGVILYIMLSGIPPFWGKTKSAIFDAVRAANLCFHSDLWSCISESAKDLIAGMLSFDRSKRLTATQVLAHPWTRDTEHSSQEPCRQYDLRHPQLDLMDGCSFSNLIAARGEDLSFHDGSPLAVNSNRESSPVFSCTSSFSSAVAKSAPSSVPEFSSPIPSILSFTFFSPILSLESSGKSLSFETKMLSIDDDGDPGIRKLILTPEPGRPIEHKSDDRAEVHSKASASVSNATMSLQSKRNLTIGVGELDHLDVIATAASVSRWASLTQISSTTSLRSSLVC
ncbi:calcium-dependent protein kinase 26-like [Andrographis paniculata]|uniref:calcium-dependent protein kinase 26-like n=1 Tax=Andrographis paniculata TaxID=175694 RepID=UPI0021E735B6|nr:calcium-dependent protein kinase 26-like [Andrographis paniculata]